MSFRHSRSSSSFGLLLVIAAAFGSFACDVGGNASKEDIACSGAACKSDARLNESCAAYDQIEIGPYRILNNLWGVQRTNIPGQQCIWQACDSSPNIGWGTSYDWVGGPRGQVESYTAALLGWHFGPIDPASGLPVQILDNRRIDCTWNYRLQNQGKADLNVAYDLWLGTDPAASSPSDEIMIWLHHEGDISPVGTSAVTGLELAGGQWTLAEGQAGTWNVHSFIRTNNAPCSQLNLNDFIQYLVRERGFDENKYLLGIEAGSEVFSAKGQLLVDSYGCQIE